MNFNQIKYAIKLAETQNFTRAAQELFISQPTLSQQIKALENEYGTEFFIREKRGEVKLSPAGEEFMHYARRIHANMNNMNAALGSYGTFHHGCLRIGLLWTFGYAGLDDGINKFQQLFPGAELSFSINGSAVLMQSIKSGECDVAFVTGSVTEGEESLLDYLLIEESDIGIIANSRHRLAQRESLTAKDLDGERVVMVSRQSNLYPDIIKSLEEVAANPIIIGNSSIGDTVLQIAKAGFGLGFMSKKVFEYTNLPGLVFLPYNPTIKRSIYLISLKENDGNKLTAEFKNFFAKRLELGI